MKSILYNIQDVASDISSFTNCDEIDYLVLNQSLHPLKILFKIIVMIIPKYRKKKFKSESIERQGKLTQYHLRNNI